MFVVHCFTNAKSLGRYRLVKDWLRLPIMSKMWCVNIFYLFPILAFDIIPVRWEKEMQYKKINAFLESPSESHFLILQESYTSHRAMNENELIEHLAYNIFKWWAYKCSFLISFILTQNKKRVKCISEIYRWNCISMFHYGKFFSSRKITRIMR